ncbi:hypothetical protein VF14_33550 [Nostoc linckia z18]|uniref:Uncharacterized protein n=2 Tax=Nostoc linckia TaxID=92942 RepID=A0A9Q5ZH01_NOSLI|nr:hypothetical protein [Nostoc linckia]PHK31606.1 hypothetical protein VF12_27780 [Nostoc linckia z15]PHK40461.1 hypothetical protein VF13_32835 [Nostoc linckia z16]PHJ55764.1 hypothetical protein VF02_35565 [Nostoc linckia z1]PHJ57071.1 hypothetical protein VF05_36320 [Nostoc linckia z3]PHJ57528.1 hypothetical protein VF03_36415 [Nostoc linckia z2]
MKRTQKYSKACQILTFPHQIQDELYAELNRLGWYWQAAKKEWERDDTPAKEATKLIRVRVWAAREIVENAADLFAENVEGMGLKLLERSNPYPCRPPNQLESRIYLTFEDLEDA